MIRHEIFVILILFFAVSCSEKEEINLFEIDFYNDPVFANTGFETFSPDHADHFVKTIDEFLKSLSEAEPYDIIYLKDDLIFDFSPEQLPVIISKPLKIVSGRKQDNSGGGILSSTNPGKTLILIQSDNVTLSGIKIIGHDTEIGTVTSDPPVTVGVLIKDFNSLLVENCEISGWSYTGIYLNNSQNNTITKNYIHQNRRKGLGYGIVLHHKVDQFTDALITYNYFNLNRHDIAGSGVYGQNYEASYNLIGNCSQGSHRFDMHGEAKDTEKNAGSKISIHHNRFLDDKCWAVAIRGIPEFEAQIFENIFPHKCEGLAVRQSILSQKIDPKNWVNITLFNNKFQNGILIDNTRCE